MIKKPFARNLYERQEIPDRVERAMQIHRKESGIFDWY